MVGILLISSMVELGPVWREKMDNFLLSVELSISLENWMVFLMSTACETSSWCISTGEKELGSRMSLLTLSCLFPQEWKL